MKKIKFSPEEISTLEELAKNHFSQKVRRRADCLLQIGRGAKKSFVAKKIGVTLNAIYNWIAVWEKRGIVGLLSTDVGGRPLALPIAWLDKAEEFSQKKDVGLEKIVLELENYFKSQLPCSQGTLRNGLISRGWSSHKSRLIGGKARRLPVKWLDEAEKILRNHDMKISLVNTVRVLEESFGAPLPCSIGTLRNYLVRRGLLSIAYSKIRLTGEKKQV